MTTIATCNMVLERDTKGAVLYKREEAPQADVEKALTSIYLRKAGLTLPYPEEITVTVTIGE